MSYCKSSNKAMRLLPVTGFNIRARILPESPLWQLKNVRHDLKGYSSAQWGEETVSPFPFYSFSLSAVRFLSGVLSPL